MEDESAVALADILSGPGDRLDYEYDLGDSCHRLVVEDVVPDSARTVRCNGGRQPAPPEDYGEVYGYGALLRALYDPNHPDFAMARQVLGDASDFDVTTVDSRLRGVPVS